MHVHTFMTTIFWWLLTAEEREMLQNANLSNWFLKCISEFTVLRWPQQSPDLILIQHLWDVVEDEIPNMDVPFAMTADSHSRTTKIAQEQLQEYINEPEALTLANMVKCSVSDSTRHEMTTFTSAATPQCFEVVGDNFSVKRMIQPWKTQTML